MTKKLIAMLLCVCMMFSTVPTTVFAEGENEPAVVEETNVQEQQTETQQTETQQTETQ